MRDKLHKINCPTCGGCGSIKVNMSYGFDKKQIKAQACKSLKKQGLTVREIAQVMGFSSSRSAQIYLEMETFEVCED
ncbi:MAG: hypothetical protein DHS20C07_19400 [Methyloligella sp.]|nr:MAG: hypothetical protein DHS20C07_19400 [Methyloligella sp.]